MDIGSDLKFPLQLVGESINVFDNISMFSDYIKFWLPTLLKIAVFSTSYFGGDHWRPEVVWRKEFESSSLSH